MGLEGVCQKSDISEQSLGVDLIKKKIAMKTVLYRQWYYLLLLAFGSAMAFLAEADVGFKGPGFGFYFLI